MVSCFRRVVVSVENVVVVSKEEKEQQRRQQVKAMKKKYGLQVSSSHVILNGLVSDCYTVDPLWWLFVYVCGHFFSQPIQPMLSQGPLYMTISLRFDGTEQLWVKDFDLGPYTVTFLGMLEPIMLHPHTSWMLWSIGYYAMPLNTCAESGSWVSEPHFITNIIMSWITGIINTVFMKYHCLMTKYQSMLLSNWTCLRSLYRNSKLQTLLQANKLSLTLLGWMAFQVST